MKAFITVAIGDIVTRIEAHEASKYLKVISTELQHCILENIDNPSDKRIVPYQFVGDDFDTIHDYRIFIKRPTLPHSTVQELQQNYPELFI